MKTFSVKALVHFILNDRQEIVVSGHWLNENNFPINISFVLQQEMALELKFF